MKRFAAILLLAWLQAAPGAARAGGLGAQTAGLATQSVIGADALQGVRGRTAVDMAAGNSNVQSNAAALAIDAGAGAAIAGAGLAQRAGAGGAASPSVSSAIIEPGAFAGADGLVSVNQASGTANAQENVAVVGAGSGAVVASDSTLAATTAGAAPAGAGAGRRGVQSAVTSDTAFAGASGLVQVNQSAGSGNITANHFALRIQADANP